MRLNHLFTSILILVFSPFIMVAQWAPKQTPIKTPWTDQVNLNKPLPEYPRPQMVRTDWLNLNGKWALKKGTAGESLPGATTFTDSILVPFPIESTLSGVIKHYDRLWYRETFIIPEGWQDKRILLNFGAVDWESEVFINGASIGVHKGGYDAFSYDITDRLHSIGEQELIVRVYDPTRDHGQPRGKQTISPGGIMYTCNTGIWQTVWLEPVSDKRISSLKLIPDIDNNCLYVIASSDSTDLTIIATAKDGETITGKITGNVNTKLSIPVPNAKLWSPDSPFLYDLTIVLKKGTITVDSISSYFGMRKISLGKVGNAKKMLLNNEFVFNIGPLDQGFWPDGIYTAPTDEALKFDIEQERALGFNMVRKHIKVEPQRWYYWADKLGIMVWQDMPSSNSYDTPSGVPVDATAFDLELNEMIKEHVNSPSIIMWVIFNEGQGQYDIARLVNIAKNLDPSRLVNQGSGGGYASPSAGDILDAHNYPSPVSPTSTTQAVVCGEYGGIGYMVKNHQWGNPNNPYSNAQTSDELVNTYNGYIGQLVNFKTFNNLSAAVYTEITDVETEINGLLTYDRILKVDANKIKAINEKVIKQFATSRTDILPTSKPLGQTWKYTITQPSSNWWLSKFDDSIWNSGKGGFGTTGTPNSLIRTIWNTNNIWLRKKFNLGGISSADLKNLSFNLHHDEDCEIYLNGVLASSLTGYSTDYITVPLSPASITALIANSENVIAVHCKQALGGQYIDVGISNIILSGDTCSALNPIPKDLSTGVDTTSLTIAWKAGNFATSHKVYFGTSLQLGDNDLLISQPDTFMVINKLQQGKTYYWRIDEINPNGTIIGGTWSFTTKLFTGKSEKKIATSMIFPNPIRKNEVLTVNIPENSCINNIKICATDGTNFFYKSIKQKESIKIDLLKYGINPGTYLINFDRNGSYSSSQKLIVL